MVDDTQNEQSEISRVIGNVDLAAAIEQHGDMVYRILRVRMQEWADVDDLYQEVFLRLMRNTTPFKDETHIRAWLCRVAVNLSHDLHKSFWQRHTVSIEQAEELAGEDKYESAVVLAVKDRKSVV